MCMEDQEHYLMLLEERVEEVKEAMSILGQWYRDDWSDFDGRMLRVELDQLYWALGNPLKPFDLEAWREQHTREGPEIVPF